MKLIFMLFVIIVKVVIYVYDTTFEMSEGLSHVLS